MDSALRELPLGWATDVAVLEHAGSMVDDRGDHLVVRTPQNPTFHWGNCLLVSDGDAVGDAERWVAAFAAAFASATWVAIGLVRMPDDVAAWAGQRLELELNDVLSTRRLPPQTALSAGYTVRRLTGVDWERSVARAMAENERTNEYASEPRERFVRARVASQCGLSERDVAAYFGAFFDGALVAELGIVRCGTAGRYQNVMTEPNHRRRGLASHLLGVAARWAAERGCDRWVIVTGASNPAGRVYRSLGFDLDVACAQAYRPEPR